MLFNGTNYHDRVPCMRLHMRELHLLEFLTGKLPCPLPPSAPAKLVILEKTTNAEKERLITNYDDHLTSCESQFSAYRTWLDEDARAGSVLMASMEDRFSADIVELERSHRMWTFLHSRYEPTGPSTFLVTIYQEQLLHQDDNTIDAFFDQISAILRQIDTLSSQFSCHLSVMQGSEGCS
jgi:hypothetical protein